MNMSASLNTSEKIEFNFTCYALKLLGRNLYSNPWTAVSEIVANGIDAKAKDIYVLVNLRNKENAEIEILDNGHGMSYNDLCEKYTIIGRNKRQDSLDDKSILGRKGIGKLAALFLSEEYYLHTKSNSESTSWVVDVSNAKDDDIPALVKSFDSPNLISHDLWASFSTGTAIKLTKVDLRKIGAERLKALPVILSDYYLSNVINCNINVCVLQNPTDNLIFYPVSKNISFSTMYSIFDNTGLNFSNRLKDKIYLTKHEDMPEEIDVQYPTIKINDFPNTEGIINMENIYGEQISAEYKMKGWIGIHASLDTNIQRRNNPSFNKINYHSNAIRLYVRGKLAVDNLMSYINNSQAFANYIEGEISFDILDDDLFEDISTSNREGYKKDDIRVKKLLDIVSKIVNKLISDRVNIGAFINNQYNDYMESLRKKEEDEKNRVTHELKLSQERESVALSQKEIAENAVRTERKRTDYIISVSNVESNNILPSMHNIYNLSILSKSYISKFKKFWDKIPTPLHKTIETIGEINSQIMYTSKAITKSNYLVDTEEKVTDISDFILEYIDRIAYKLYNSKIKIIVSDNLSSRFLLSINQINFITIIENIIGNSIKAKATNLYIIFEENKDSIMIKFKDDGVGLDDNLLNPYDIFEFGYTTTTGSGLGLYYSKKYIENMGGIITIDESTDSGLCLIAKWKREKNEFKV